MSKIAQTLIQLYHRDLDRLSHEINEIPNEHLWKTLPGVVNTCGVLTQHLIGNLQHFVGKELGNTGYERDRGREFTNTKISKTKLIADIEELKNAITSVLGSLSDDDLKKSYPQTFPYKSSVQEGLIHLYGHLNYHLGQVNYLRRMIEEKG